ncbi:MAG: DUF736 family protein [Pseudomonadota bacterium]
MDVNTLEKTDDGAFVGNMASFDYDFDFTLKPAEKRTEKSPDFEMMVKSPRGRLVPIGAAWTKTGQTSGKEYLSMTADLRGIGRVNVNAVTDPELPEGSFKVIPFAATEQNGGAA